MITQTEICPGIWLFSSEAAFVNATLIRTDTCNILVDTMLRPMDSHAIQTFLQSQDIQLSYIFNTHWHSDHCFGNRILRHPMLSVISHRLHAETLRKERNMFKPGHSKEAEKSLVPEPDIVFENTCCIDRGTMHIDGDMGCNPEIRILHAPGHTPDMSYLYMADENLLIAGDNVLSNDLSSIALPYFFWGNCRDLIKSQRMILNLGVQTIIPGHGKPVGRDKIEADLSYLELLSSLGQQLLDENPKMDISAHEELLKREIKALSIYPVKTSMPIWVPSVHDLNIKRLVLDWHAQHEENASLDPR